MPFQYIDFVVKPTAEQVTCFRSSVSAASKKIASSVDRRGARVGAFYATPKQLNISCLRFSEAKNIVYAGASIETDAFGPLLVKSAEQFLIDKSLRSKAIGRNCSAATITWSNERWIVRLSYNPAILSAYESAAWSIAKAEREYTWLAAGAPDKGPRPLFSYTTYAERKGNVTAKFVSGGLPGLGKRK
mgnify:FL=1